jgi:uncharacterized SAM-binding protein YcdF (DUF218 family)
MSFWKKVHTHEKYFIYNTVLFLLAGCAYTQKTCSKLLSKAEMNKPYDAIIVPGIPYDQGRWSRTMKGRVYWAYFLYKKGIANNVIFSGGAVYSPYIEAEIMALYGEALGIPREHIFIEPTAEHSTENLYYSFRIAKKMNFQKVAFATDPFQSKLLNKFVKKFNLQMDMIPMVFDTLDAIPKTDPVINDQKAFAPGFVSILERENFWERLRGTRGKKIKFGQ